MTDLFLEPKVLDYSADRYQLILLTLRWARVMKAKGTPEPMNALIEQALRDIVEGRITKEEILANKVAVEEPKDVPAVVSVAAEEDSKELKLAADEGDEKKKAKKKKKKEE